eukprot:366334-Chlamydomonas_euryale.AAC.7
MFTVHLPKRSLPPHTAHNTLCRLASLACSLSTSQNAASPHTQRKTHLANWRALHVHCPPPKTQPPPTHSAKHTLQTGEPCMFTVHPCNAGPTPPPRKHSAQHTLQTGEPVTEVSVLQYSPCPHPVGYVQKPPSLR